jgi:3'-phosphoadenosine 5'-phosphosulfate sulfotransferase (PAPS reductase)/FAD synthetase
MNNQHIISFSGGKDSTAMLLMMIEKEMKIDRIICVDTTKEFPEMYQHILKVQKMILPYEIEVVKLNFDYWFNDYVLKKGKNIGRVGYGWPSFRFRWCSGLKMEAFRATIGSTYNPKCWGQTKKSSLYNTKIYIGYSTDELSRMKKDASLNEIYPLIDFNMSSQDALQYCYSRNLDWNGLYEEMSRVSCWCCPLSRIGELRILYNKYPCLWGQLEKLDKKSYRKFRPDYSVTELKEKFIKENS